MADGESSRSYGRRHLLAYDSVSQSTVSDGPATVNGSDIATVWRVKLVVGNNVVFVCCIIVILLYLVAVVTRIVLHAFWGPVSIT